MTTRMFSKPEIIPFPAERGHHGAALGNGYLGLLIWGGGRKLCVSIGCCALWDRTGGIDYPRGFTLETVKAALKSGDEAFLRRCAGDQQPHAPTMLPAGRLEITLPEGFKLIDCQLPAESGKAIVNYQRNDSSSGALEFLPGRGKDLQNVFAVKTSEHFLFQLIDPQKLNEDGFFARNRYAAVIDIDDGFVQKIPSGGGYTLRMKSQKDVMTVQLQLFETESFIVSELPAADIAACESLNLDYWRKFWQKVPRLDLPNRKLTELYRKNLRVFGSAMTPDGAAAGLQGPFLEDDRVPPWGADYHFNVNEQMVYAPALAANLYEHLQPLLQLLIAWKPVLRENARRFAGVENGYLLPHATDDSGKFMGWGFWSGMIDFASGPWMADMMWQYVLLSGDRAFLRAEGFDFMRGCMELCRAVLMRREDGTLILPISISPEFNGTELSSVGSNASYQLAAMHRLARDLIAAAKLLEQTPDPFWTELLEKLPDAAVADGPHGGEEVAVFDNIKLPEGHRHHSHLGAVWPFGTLSAEDDRIKRAYISWLLNGTGTFLGWSFSWAVRLNTRFGYGETAEHMLEVINDFFSNHGHLPTGMSRYRGISGAARPGSEMMQLDGGMDSVGALLDMFVECRDGVVKLLPAVPEPWEKFSVRKLSGGCGVRIDCCCEGKNKYHIKIVLRRNQPFLLKLPDVRSGQWKSLSDVFIAPDNLCRIDSMKYAALEFVSE